MRVVRASTSALLAQFIDLPSALYANDRNWVPPYRRDVAHTVSRRRNPFFQVADIQHFVAFDGAGRPAGRVAACIHPAYNNRFSRRYAFFGFFESIANSGVAGALLGEVERWADERGMEAVAGPCSYCPTQDAGLLVEGFNSPPALLQPYNPPYYDRLIRDAGYEPFLSIATYSGDVSALRERTPALLARGDRVLERQGLTARTLDMRRLDRERARLLDLFNDAFSQNAEVAPVEDEVFRFQTSALQAIVDPRLIIFIEREGVPLAFALALPNFNEVLLKHRGRITLPMLLRRKAVLRSIRSMVIVLVGARRSAQGLGLSRVVLAELLRNVVAAGYQRFHTTWVDGDNGMMRAGIQRFGHTQPDKRYAIYRKTISGRA